MTRQNQRPGSKADQTKVVGQHRMIHGSQGFPTTKGQRLVKIYFLGTHLIYDDDRCKCEKQLNSNSRLVGGGFSSILRRFFREMIYVHFWSNYSDLTRPHPKR